MCTKPLRTDPSDPIDIAHQRAWDHAQDEVVPTADVPVIRAGHQLRSALTPICFARDEIVAVVLSRHGKAPLGW